MRLFVFLLAACMMLPAVHANSADYAFNGDYTSAQVVLKEELPGNTAKSFRQQVDQSGDNDGNVTQEEVDAFLTTIVGSDEANFAAMLGAKNFAIDGNGTTSTKVDSLTALNGPGKTTSTLTITLVTSGSATYDTLPLENHTLSMKASSASGTTSTVVVVHAGSGTVIKATTGARGVTTTDGTQITYGSSQGEVPAGTIKFGPKPPTTSSSSSSSRSSSSSSSSAPSSTSHGSSSSSKASSTSASSSKPSSQGSSSMPKASPDVNLALLIGLVAVGAAIRRRLP